MRKCEAGQAPVAASSGGSCIQTLRGESEGGGRGIGTTVRLLTSPQQMGVQSGQVICLYADLSSAAQKIAAYLDGGRIGCPPRWDAGVSPGSCCHARRRYCASWSALQQRRRRPCICQAVLAVRLAGSPKMHCEGR